VIDVRAIFQQGNRALEIAGMPTLLLPRKGIFGLVDYEKIFTIDTRSGADIFETRGISRSKGCMVIVRPDQYTANILPLDATDELARYFDALLC
jgi:phenol 2-monooxygenase